MTGASKAAAIGSIFAASDIHCVDGVSCCELHVTESNHYPASLIRYGIKPTSSTHCDVDPCVCVCSTERSGMPVRWVLDAAAASTLVALSQNTRVMKSD